MSSPALVHISSPVTARITMPPANNVTLIFVRTYPITETQVKYQREAEL